MPARVFVVCICFFFTSLEAFSLSWKDVDKSWKKATEDANSTLDDLGVSLDKLKSKVQQLVSEIADIKAKTPVIDFGAIEQKLKISDRALNVQMASVSWNQMSKLGDIEIGGDIGRFSNRLKKDISIRNAQKTLSHWGNEVEKCLKDGRWLNLCQYTICKVDSSLEWADSDSKEFLECEKKKALIESEALQAEFNENKELIKGIVEQSSSELSQKLAPYRESN